MTMFYFDSTYILVLLGMALAMFAQYRVKSTFEKYQELETANRVNGRQAAEFILQQANIPNVAVGHISGQLTDHYDPRDKTLKLSDATYQSTSVAAVAVAAHECGHAVQDAQGYFFLKFRNAIVPVVQIGSSLAMPLILMGLIMSWAQLFNLGLILFSLALIFQLVTLPVEFDASRRALSILQDNGLFTQAEIPAARAVLRAAAFTYVAATISTALQLLRFILLANNRRR
ncbi:zinc metallopeptidase [Ignavigranum ruoffiae]|nr:zinc metallopeptidase [Ignavigranum ruoffiae]UPQ86298.1 zinc metallopeptidase [Ignavigranum ruoffiae]